MADMTMAHGSNASILKSCRMLCSLWLEEPLHAGIVAPPLVSHILNRYDADVSP
jgi:hypothetical protein